MRTKKLRNLKISNKNLNNCKKKILIKKNYQKNIVKIISGSLSPNQIIKEKELYFQTIGNRFKIFLSQNLLTLDGSFKKPFKSHFYTITESLM